MLVQIGKSNTRKNNNKICGNKLERTGERRKIKKISSNGNIDKTDHSKTRKKILSRSRGR